MTKPGSVTPVQIVAGGVSGVTAIALILGVVVARLTTSTRESSAVMIAGVTIAGAFLGGFVAAPYLNRLSRKSTPATQGKGSVPSA